MRQEITSQKLMEFIIEGKSLCREIDQHDFSVATDLEQADTLSLIEKVSAFLQKADEGYVINANMTYEVDSWFVGKPTFEEKPIYRGIRICSADSKVRLDKPSRYFYNAVCRTINMAKDILREPTQNQIPNNLTHPYNQTDWLPAIKAD